MREQEISLSIKDDRNMYLIFPSGHGISDSQDVFFNYYSAKKHRLKMNLLLPLPRMLPMMAASQREFLFSIYYVSMWTSSAFFFFPPPPLYFMAIAVVWSVLWSSKIL